MSPILIAGVIIVNLALIAYSVAIITEQRKKSVNRFILTFLTAGVFLDITATICMIIGSENSFITFHGMIGYLALIVMFIDGIFLWKTWLVAKAPAPVPAKLHLYSRYAYIWWVVAYITGALIVALN
ncbi:MAG: hypothetical protein IPN08_17645 [Bacteroidales bacterium]|nr:hypothetical protein [Bacteroidales bacterium]